MVAAILICLLETVVGVAVGLAVGNLIVRLMEWDRW